MEKAIPTMLASVRVRIRVRARARIRVGGMGGKCGIAFSTIAQIFNNPNRGGKKIAIPGRGGP